MTRTPHRLLVLLVGCLFILGCAAYPGTRSLWIGMTRSQALRAMGPPESVSAQGAFEYLNYTLPTKVGGYTVGRPYYIRIINDAVESYGYGSQFTTAMMPPMLPMPPTISGPAIIPAPAPTSGAVKQNSVHVLSVEPATLLLDRPNHLKVKLSYALHTQASGMISVSFNTKTPGMQLSLATKVVSQGDGELEIPVEVLPVGWANRSDVKMLVSLFPSPNSNGASSLDFVQWDLPVTK